MKAFLLFGLLIAASMLSLHSFASPIPSEVADETPYSYEIPNHGDFFVDDDTVDEDDDEFHDDDTEDDDEGDDELPYRIKRDLEANQNVTTDAPVIASPSTITDVSTTEDDIDDDDDNDDDEDEDDDDDLIIIDDVDWSILEDLEDADDNENDPDYVPEPEDEAEEDNEEESDQYPEADEFIPFPEAV